jgi:AcrR family transcriptional regulator
VKQNENDGKRDKEGTKKRLIDAALDLLREEGFESLGVNAVAQRAGVGKVLIYRYFGGFQGLLQSLADEIDPLKSRNANDLLAGIPENATAGAILEEVVLALHDAVSRDELTKQLMIWELSRQNDVTRTLGEAREKVGLELTRMYADHLSSGRTDTREEELDYNALFALVVAGVMYLTLRSDTVQMYNGVDIQSPRGWKRIAAVLRRLIDLREDTKNGPRD